MGRIVGSPAIDVVIRELGAELLDGYLAFFDQDAFADNPGWSHCYCAFFHSDFPDDESSWSSEGRARHRAFKAELIRSGKAPGLLAYFGNKVVGWCNAGPRAGYQNLRHRGEAVEDPTERVGSILCFIIARAYRGRGVATALLAAACEKFEREGFAVIEGYPTVRFLEFPDDLPMSARNYPGPLSMYLKAGFSVHREIGNWAVVRKRLGKC